jgi:hypothetical protein
MATADLSFNPNGPGHQFPDLKHLPPDDGGSRD